MRWRARRLTHARDALLSSRADHYTLSPIRILKAEDIVVDRYLRVEAANRRISYQQIG